MNQHSPRRVLDVVVGIIIAAISLMLLANVLQAVLMTYMLQLIIATAVVVVIWLVLRMIMARRMW